MSLSAQDGEKPLRFFQPDSLLRLDSFGFTGCFFTSCLYGRGPWEARQRCRG